MQTAVKRALEAALGIDSVNHQPDKVLYTVPEENGIPEPLRAAMRYSLLLPGKRLRPTLLLAGYALVAADWEAVMPFALAIEMIHAYSLIHDDLPALDNDDLRRGKPTNHRVFGENVAILAGDGLYSLAFETMLTASLQFPNPENAIAAMEEIASRAGVRGMIGGQTMDVVMEGQTPNHEMVGYIHRHKTADLITAAVVAGLRLAGADADAIVAGETYGQKLGLAFQIVDDLLDLEGDVATLGKQTGMDAQRGKMTWPAVYGEQAARIKAAQLSDEAIAALAPFGEKASELRELVLKTLNRVR